MTRWSRRAPLDGATSGRLSEIWQSEEDQASHAFSIDVTVGKPLDVVALKGASTDETREYADFLRKTAATLYASGRSRNTLAACPCCLADAARALEAFAVFGVSYHECPDCGHTFIRSQPSREALDELFSHSEEHSTTYTDRKTVETRLQQVMQPKFEWVSRTYAQHRSRPPRSVLDIGAAGGHFIEVARRAGMSAEGFELSESSRLFAKTVFQIDLHQTDFLATDVQPGTFDVVTFWGLLEYVAEPRRFLERARRWLTAAEGMLVVEVPRINCVGSAVQRAFPASVARHLDPTSHVNLFSDSSLVSALVATGFRPVAAWYFGMDAYEVVMQMAMHVDDRRIVEQLAPLIPALQASMDAGRVCDDIVVAAVPLTGA